MNRDWRIISVLIPLALGAGCAKRTNTGGAPAVERKQSALIADPATSISSQVFHSCAVLESGGVVCWGENFYGQLGNDASPFSAVPVTVSLPAAAVSVATGSYHTCAALESGQVACWGEGDSGQLGNGTFNPSPTPVTVSGLVDAVAVAANQWGSCALRSTGEVACWGSDSQGQLGNGSGVSSSNVPVAVSGLSDAQAITAAGLHVCALRESGQVVCWGWDSSGQLGNGGLNIPIPSPVAVVGLSDAVAISAGHVHTCALRATGEVVCWGSGSYGQLGIGTGTQADVPVAVPFVSDAAAIAAGYLHTCIARATGAVFCWGDSNSGQLGSPAWPTDAVSLAAGISHTCTLDGSGEILCWGDGTYGQLGNGSARVSSLPIPTAGLSDAVAVAAGIRISCAARAGGRVACWGNDATLPVEVDGIAGAVGVAASYAGACALDGGGTVKCWGDLVPDEDSASLPPTTILGDAVQITAHGGRLCAARTSGEVGCWGLLFGGSFSISMTPANIAGVTDAVAVAAGRNHACAVRAGGGVVCWGDDGTFGQLGNGGTTASAAPVPVSGLSDATKIAAGDDHTCARRAAGSVVCWGDGGSGQLGNGSGAQSPVPVAVAGLSDAVTLAAGDAHTCAVRVGGQVVCWGDGTDGQLGNGSQTVTTTPVTVAGLSDAVAIGAGRNHTCAVRAGGQVVCWGSDGSGELGNGSPWKSARPVPVSGLSSLASFGNTCTTSATCASGVCVDGFCCSASCGTDGSDCQACSIAAGGTANGFCTPRKGQTCGGAVGICETHVCGQELTCPAPAPVPMCVPESVSECATGSCRTITLSDPSMGGYSVTITFPAGMMAGDIRVVPCGVDTVRPPSEYEILGGATAPACWDLHTTASYPHASWPPMTPVPNLTVCITYPPEVIDGIDDVSVLQLAHFTSGGLSMITIDPLSGQVCGTTPSLSPFAILVPRDRTRPVFGDVSGPLAAYATSAAGATVTYPTPTAVDADSSPTTVGCTPTSGSTFPIGQSNVTCTATDAVGNKATATIPVWVQVQAPTDGSFFLPPINPDGSSIFKQGSTIPVRFQLSGASASIGDLTARLSATKISAGVSGTELEATSNGAASSGDLFRYAGAGQYLFNLSTKPLAAGTWSLRADLGDGVTHQINVSLKK